MMKLQELPVSVDRSPDQLAGLTPSDCRCRGFMCTTRYLACVASGPQLRPAVLVLVGGNLGGRWQVAVRMQRLVESPGVGRNSSASIG